MDALRCNKLRNLRFLSSLQWVSSGTHLHLCSELLLRMVHGWAQRLRSKANKMRKFMMLNILYETHSLWFGFAHANIQKCSANSHRWNKFRAPGNCKRYSIEKYVNFEEWCHEMSPYIVCIQWQIWNLFDIFMERRSFISIECTYGRRLIETKSTLYRLQMNMKCVGYLRFFQFNSMK